MPGPRFRIRYGAAPRNPDGGNDAALITKAGAAKRRPGFKAFAESFESYLPLPELLDEPPPIPPELPEPEPPLMPDEEPDVPPPMPEPEVLESEEPPLVPLVPDEPLLPMPDELPVEPLEEPLVSELPLVDEDFLDLSLCVLLLPLLSDDDPEVSDDELPPDMPDVPDEPDEPDMPDVPEPEPEPVPEL